MFPNCVNKFPPVPAHSKIARKNFHRFRHVPRLREQISTGSGMFPNCANKFPLVPAHSQTARTNFRSFRHVPRPARRDFRSVLESYWVLTGNLLRQICAFYMLSALSPRTLYICAMGGVIDVGFLRSASLGMAKAQGKRHSRRVLGEVFPEIAFSFVCVIVLCASQDSPCDDFPRTRNYSTLLFSCIE